MAAKLITNLSWNKTKVLKSQGRHWEFMKYRIRKLAIQILRQQGKNNQTKLQIELDYIYLIYTYIQYMKIRQEEPLYDLRENVWRKGEKMQNISIL